MVDFASLMVGPFLACLILTGIHAYLGMHIIKREVIFVDLALAQIAALGSTVGSLVGYHLHSVESYFLALVCTLCGAAVFAATRFEKPVVPHEAIIGIVYAVSAAASVLVLSRSPDGGEELKSLMVGHLLFVDKVEIIKLFLIYAAIGIIHYRFRREFFLISEDPKGAREAGLNVLGWDFLFYATFGCVVTSSVEVAGVLLVFSFLIVPAVCSTLLSSHGYARLWVGWGIGTMASIIGIAISYLFDLPTGAAVVCVFGVITAIIVLLRRKSVTSP